jgi:hypothetical protein
MTATASAAGVSHALERHVNNVLLATVLYEHRREHCDAIQRRLLAEGEYFTARSWAEKYKNHTTPVHRITDPKELFLMEEPWTEFYDKLDAAYRAAGYTDIEPGHCPAFIAETLKRDAEHILVEAASEFFPGVTVDKLLCCANGLEKLAKFIDLCIKLVVNRPGYVPVEVPRPNGWDHV